MSKYSNQLEVAITSPAESYLLGIKAGKLLSLNKLIIQILEHSYTVDNIKSAIDTMRDEIRGETMTSEQYEKEARADHLTGQF